MIQLVLVLYLSSKHVFANSGGGNGLVADLTQVREPTLKNSINASR